MPIYFLLSDVKADLVRRRLQFVLPSKPIQEVRSPEQFGDEHAAVVITKRADLDQISPGTRFLGEFSGPLRLWAIGSVAGLDGYTAPARRGSMMPYRSKLAAEGAQAPIVIRWGSPLRRWLYNNQPAWTPWGTRVVQVGVRHEDPYPWPVGLRVGVIWEREEEPGVRVAEYRSFDLPRLPGQSKQIAIPIRPYRNGGQPLDPGRYVLTVGLVEEGVRWLSEPGNPTISFSIVLTE